MHLIVDAELSHDFTIILVIVDDAFHHTDAVTVGIDRTRSRKSADIIEFHVVMIIRREQSQSFQELEAEVEHHDSDDGYQCDLDFFCILPHNICCYLIPLFFLNSRMASFTSTR